MNLAQMIHQRWAAAESLCALLPVDRVSTGMSAGAARPFAIISKESDRPLEYCNDGSSFGSVGVRIRVFADHYDAAIAVVQQIKVVFDRAAFSLSNGDKVVHMQRSDDSERQNDNGTWEMTIDFQCTVYLTAGA
jgi:hypothetical protein